MAVPANDKARQRQEFTKFHREIAAERSGIL
jgi:hypothetical protein